LEPVPYPEIVELEDQVRAQLGDARKALEERLAAGAEDRELARLFGETGMLYHAYELHEAASACYRNASRLAPDDFRWVYYLGQVSLRTGQPERARAELERALEIRPDELPALIRLARVELARNRPDRAETLFRHALEIDANSAAALLGLGKIALAKRDFESAVRHLEAARTLAPQATKIHYPLALAYRGLGRLEMASTLLDQLGDVPAPLDDPWMRQIGALVGGMRVHQIQGTLHFQEGQYELALAEFKRAVEEAPDEPLVRTNLALTLIQLGDPDGAEREFEHALSLDSSDAFAHYNLGTLLLDSGRYEAAVGHFEAAIERDAGQLRAHFNLGKALERLGRHEAALPHYRRVVEDDPGNAAARVTEARALAALGRWAEAHRRLEEALAAGPEDLSIRNDLARLLAAAPDGEIRDGRRALELAQVLATPQMTLEHVETLAMVAAENGMFEKAVELQRRAVESARNGDREELMQGLLRNLDRYRGGQACRDPWPES
jgi:tetratricopeptide (TPR) repeat protein